MTICWDYVLTKQIAICIWNSKPLNSPLQISREYLQFKVNVSANRLSFVFFDLQF